MNWQIDQTVVLYDRKKLPLEIFDLTQPLKIAGIMKCPHCGKIKLGITTIFGIVAWLSEKRFTQNVTSIKEQLKKAISTEDYETAAKLRDEQKLREDLTTESHTS